MTVRENLILDTDSYKLSHWTQYPPGTTAMMSYLEARGGQFQDCTLFGLQYLLARLQRGFEYFDVDEAEAFARSHGEPFNAEGWRRLRRLYDGRLPLRIRAIPEGLVVPTGNALMTVESLDPEAFWLVSWFETMLVRLWYPNTVAIASRESKKILMRYLEETSEAPESEIAFKLHDFGSRGVTSREQAQLGGAAHLLSFLGSDTIEGIRLANDVYEAGMAGFSIPASEHSTVSMWGPESEPEMFKAYIEQFLVNRQVPAGTPKLAACVSDTYDVFNAVKLWTSDPLLSMIRGSGGTLVIRPDSGDPLEVLPQILQIMADQLGAEVTVNSKGFRVLPPYFRLIQGDGITQQSMEQILRRLTELKWSASNIAFGSGGGLLQQWNRDTQKWAFKCCAAQINAEWRGVSKAPVTDLGKRSKQGRLDLIRVGDRFETVALPDGQVSHPESVMNTVFANGRVLWETSFAQCRERMAL